MRRSSIIFLGPCHKIDRRSGSLFEPFSPLSRSGGFLRSIVQSLSGVEKIEFLFDNIIATSVHAVDGKEINPNATRLIEALQGHNIWAMDRSSLVIGLSGIVAKALQTVEAQTNARSSINGPQLFFLEHPSYVMRRPQNERSNFKSRLINRIEQHLQDTSSVSRSDTDHQFASS